MPSSSSRFPSPAATDIRNEGIFKASLTTDVAADGWNYTETRRTRTSGVYAYINKLLNKLF